MKKNVLLVNDMPGFGKVALSAMVPLLSIKGHSIYNLPTALVSNTLDYGKFEILDTTDYMEKTLDVWNQLGFSFDCIATGFIVTLKQVQMICDYVASKEKKPFVLVDPIMGDEGKLYNGIDDTTVQCMCKLASMADVVIPNFTEACFMANKLTGRKDASKAEIIELIDTLHGMGSKNVVITSAVCEGKHCVMGWDDAKQEYFTIEFDYIPIQFPGTGDIFSAVLLGELLNEKCLQESVKEAMNLVRELIHKNKDIQDTYKGIQIESYLAEMVNHAS